MPILGGVKGEYFSQSAINSVLAQEGVVGVRIYLGLSDDLIPLPRLVIVGVDANENDITAGDIVENGTFCPPSCGSINYFKQLKVIEDLAYLKISLSPVILGMFNKIFKHDRLASFVFYCLGAFV